MKFAKGTLVLLVVGMLFSSPLKAATNSWTGAASDGLWSTPGNWSLGTVPISSDDVVIAASSVQVLQISNIAAVCNSLSIGAGANLQSLTLTTSTPSSLTISTTCTIGSQGSILIDSGASLACSGAITVQNGGILSASDSNVSASAVTNSGDVTVSGIGIIQCNSNYTQTAGITAMSSGGAINGGSGGLSLQAGSFVVSNSANVTGNVNNTGAQLSIAAGATLSVTGGYTQGAAAGFASTISSPTSFGALAASGAANLNGVVTAAVSYTPSLGDTYQLLTYSSVTGQFASILPPNTSNGLFLAQGVTSSHLALMVVASVAAPTILTVSSSQDVALVNTPIDFAATASDPNNFPLIYNWDFGDGSPVVSGGFVTHSYLIEGVFPVLLTVSNGSSSVTSSLTITTVAPNSGGQGIGNISQGAPEVIDPLTMLGISVMSSDGGIIQLNIDTDNLRGAFNVSTEFDGIGTRSNLVSGNSPINKFVAPGVFVANVSATDPVSNALKGKGRKTLAISGAEVGQPPDIKTPPKNQGISKAKLKGKFTFTNADTLGPLAASAFDSVSLSGVIELPEGFDLSVSHEFDIAIGNIIDAVTVSSKGKATLPGSAKIIKNVAVKYPKVKGATRSAAGQTASVTVTMAGSNFSKNGFDTEGVSNNVTATEKALKSINRSIQVAMVVGGTPYQFSAPVSFKLAKTGTSGTIGTRSGQ